MWASQIPFVGFWVLPMILFTTVGSSYVELFVNSLPQWLMVGLKVASGMLPALGSAILLRQLPMKKYGYFILLGFVLSAYLKLSILAIALLSAVLCCYLFQAKEAQRKTNEAATVVAGGDMEDE